MYSFRPLQMAVQKLGGQLEPTYNISVRIRGVALGTYRKVLTIGSGGERGSGISLQMARYDDDDDLLVMLCCWDKVICFYHKIPENVLLLILQDGFWLVHIQFVHMVKFKFLVDHLFFTLFSLIFLLGKLATFVYYENNGFVSITTKSKLLLFIFILLLASYSSSNSRLSFIDVWGTASFLRSHYSGWA